MAKFIVIEGPDRVGKATQTRLLCEAVRQRGISAKVVEVPIKSAITYRLIYWMLRNGSAKKFPKIFQVLQFINRKIFQVFTLPKLEDDYELIIMDRWSLSTIVYGSAEGLSLSFTKTLANWLRKPDHTIVLHGYPFSHVSEDVYEADEILQKKVRVGYAVWALQNKEESTLIGCQNDKDLILNNILDVLSSKGIILQ